MTDKFVCIYHGNCADGFAAAWVIRKAFNERKLCYRPGIDWDNATIEYIAGVYQQNVPINVVRDAHVFIVDFSYSPVTMRVIADAALSVTWIDHHKSAIEFMEADVLEANAPMPHNFTASTSIERSGAYLTWEYFFGGDAEPMPKLIEHIDDRDRWQFKLPKTREIQANIFSYPYDFKVWDEMMEQDDKTLKEFAVAGEAIERKHFKDIKELLAVCKRTITVGGYDVPSANLPYTLSSDAGHMLADERDKDSNLLPAFGAVYFQNADGDYVFSLRSVGDFDVSAVAAKYGGGGHRNASGFKVSPAQFKNNIVTY